MNKPALVQILKGCLIKMDYTSINRFYDTAICRILICHVLVKGGGNIGRLLIMEFADNENSTFDEVMELLKKYPDFQKCIMQKDSKLSFPGIEIYPERRRVYCNNKEVHLTAKEYRLLWLLAVNKGQVLTYQQIYEIVWGDFSSGGESTAIGYHICNLRDKLYAVFPDAPFEIRCVREVGYCFEVHSI